MNGQEKSYSAIVAEKPTNGAGQPAEEPVEPRAGAKGKAIQQSAFLDSVPGSRVTGAGAHTESGNIRFPSIPEAGTGCLNWARPGLCGGRPVMDVPTAILGIKP